MLGVGERALGPPLSSPIGRYIVQVGMWRAEPLRILLGGLVVFCPPGIPLYYGKCIVMYPNLFIADVTTSNIRSTQNMKERAIKMKWDLNLYDI